MEQQEKDLRTKLHDLARDSYFSNQHGGFRTSIADLATEIASLETTGSCRFVPAQSCGLVPEEWVKVLDLNYQRWTNIVNKSFYDYLAFDIFGLRAMNHGMKATVEAILDFYFCASKGKSINHVGDALLGFITDMPFFYPVIQTSHSTDTEIEFYANFNQALQIGESSLEYKEDGTFTERHRYFFISNFNDFNNLMLGIRLFISDKTPDVPIKQPPKNVTLVASGLYVVRTQAGFKQALKDYFPEGSLDSREPNNWPNTYPSLVSLTTGYQGHLYPDVNCIPLLELKAAIDKQLPPLTDKV